MSDLKDLEKPPTYVLYTGGTYGDRIAMQWYLRIKQCQGLISVSDVSKWKKNEKPAWLTDTPLVRDEVQGGIAVGPSAIEFLVAYHTYVKNGGAVGQSARSSSDAPDAGGVFEAPGARIEQRDRSLYNDPTVTKDKNMSGRNAPDPRMDPRGNRDSSYMAAMMARDGEPGRRPTGKMDEPIDDRKKGAANDEAILAMQARRDAQDGRVRRPV